MAARLTPLNAVVDTNVVAYHLLHTKPFGREVSEFWERAGRVTAPASWEAELTNVLWLAVRGGLFNADEGRERLRLARQLRIESVAVDQLWEGALVRATIADHPAYDTLFVELAERLEWPLVTFDRSLLRKFPEQAVRPKTIVG